MHTQSIFVTLTYNDEHLPGIDVHPGGTLYKRDLQLFFKKLRKAGLKFRYLAVGEYGEKHQRAHYHAILFGLGIEAYQLIEENWQQGFVHVRELDIGRAQYTAGYCVKKLSGEKEDDYLQGRKPEFMLTSRKPGIGYEAAELIAETMVHHKTRTRFFYNNSIRMRGHILPLDQYMLDAINAFLQKLSGSKIITDGAVLRTANDVYHRAELHDRSALKAEAARRKAAINKKKVSSRFTE